MVRRLMGSWQLLPARPRLRTASCPTLGGGDACSLFCSPVLFSLSQAQRAPACLFECALSLLPPRVCHLPTLVPSQCPGVFWGPPFCWSGVVLWAQCNYSVLIHTIQSVGQASESLQLGLTVPAEESYVSLLASPHVGGSLFS